MKNVDWRRDTAQSQGELGTLSAHGGQIFSGSKINHSRRVRKRMNNSEEKLKADVERRRVFIFRISQKEKVD